MFIICSPFVCWLIDHLCMLCFLFVDHKCVHVMDVTDSGGTDSNSSVMTVMIVSMMMGVAVCIDRHEGSGVSLLLRLVLTMWYLSYSKRVK